MPEQIQDRKVFSLLEVSKSIQKTLSERYTSNFWIRAEINKMNLYAQSGHCYPELVEKKDGRVIAEFRSVLWRDDFNRTNQQFLDILGEPLRDGITVLLSARIQYDTLYGLSLRITEIDPWYSLGELEKEKQLSIQKLKAEGIFDTNKNLRLPLVPSRITIISADTSKGYSDFMKIMQGNPWGYKFFSMLFPAFLQGDKAAPSIMAQLEKIKRVREHFDLVAIIRGGGGDVGLTCYNNYDLSKAIAEYPLPVLTGIGHSTNETVSEMVAYKNAITPTELADFIIQRYHNFSAPVQDAEKTLLTTVRWIISDERNSLLSLGRLLKSASRNYISSSESAIEYSTKSLIHQSRSSIQQFRQATSRESINLQRAVAGMSSRQRTVIRDQEASLAAASKSYFRDQLNGLNNLEKVLRVLSPENVLKRGYSITTMNGRLLRDIKTVKPGEEIVTIIQDGKLVSTVRETEANLAPAQAGDIIETGINNPID